HDLLIVRAMKNVPDLFWLVTTLEDKRARRGWISCHGHLQHHLAVDHCSLKIASWYARGGFKMARRIERDAVGLKSSLSNRRITGPRSNVSHACNSCAVHLQFENDCANRLQARAIGPR